MLGSQVRPQRGIAARRVLWRRQGSKRRETTTIDDKKNRSQSSSKRKDAEEKCGPHAGRLRCEAKAPKATRIRSTSRGTSCERPTKGTRNRGRGEISECAATAAQIQIELAKKEYLASQKSEEESNPDQCHNQLRCWQRYGRQQTDCTSGTTCTSCTNEMKPQMKPQDNDMNSQHA